MSLEGWEKHTPPTGLCGSQTQGLIWLCLLPGNRGWGSTNERETRRGHFRRNMDQRRPRGGGGWASRARPQARLLGASRAAEAARRRRQPREPRDVARPNQRAWLRAPATADPRPSSRRRNRPARTDQAEQNAKRPQPWRSKRAPRTRRDRRAGSALTTVRRGPRARVRLPRGRIRALVVPGGAGQDSRRGGNGFGLSGGTGGSEQDTMASCSARSGGRVGRRTWGGRRTTFKAWR